MLLVICLFRSIQRLIHLRRWFLDQGDTVVCIASALQFFFVQNVLRICVFNQSVKKVFQLLINRFTLLLQLSNLFVGLLRRIRLFHFIRRLSGFIFQPANRLRSCPSHFRYRRSILRDHSARFRHDGLQLFGHPVNTITNLFHFMTGADDDVSSPATFRDSLLSVPVRRT